MRKLLRSIAKSRMARENIPHFCRQHDHLGTKKDSIFSQYWREFVGIKQPVTKAKNKRHKTRKAFA